MSDKQLKGGSLADGARYAEGCRKNAAGYKSTPPAGPRPEPVKVNGVPMIKTGGTSR